MRSEPIAMMRSTLGSGTSASSSTFWRGDGSWATPAGGSPSGSTTQPQYNNAGAFGGSADLVKSATGLDIGNTTGDGYAARLGVKATGNGTIFVASDDGGIPYFTVQQLTGNHPFITFGIDVAGNFTNFLLDDSAKQIGFYTPLGVCQLGDWQSNGNGSQWKIDDANQKTTSNVKHEGSNASGTYFDVGANGTWQAGDVAAIGSSTKIIIDDSTTRIELNATKPVIGDTNGQFYVYNGNTSTYWRYKPNGSGVLTGTDTGSGSLP